jgi:hypothetical protein
VLDLNTLPHSSSLSSYLLLAWHPSHRGSQLRLLIITSSTLTHHHHAQLHLPPPPPSSTSLSLFLSSLTHSTRFSATCRPFDEQRSKPMRLAIGSFVEEYTNKVCVSKPQKTTLALTVTLAASSLPTTGHLRKCTMPRTAPPTLVGTA